MMPRAEEEEVICNPEGGGGKGTPLHGLYIYGDVPLDRVWFLASLS